MKWFKRSVAVILTLVMILSMISGISAAEAMSVTIGSASLSKGSSVILPVTIANHDRSNPVGSINSRIKYDTENLKLTQITADYYEIDENSEDTALLYAGSLSANPATGVVGWGSQNGLNKTSGTLYWMVFTTQDDVANGTYTIEMEAYLADSVFYTKDNIWRCSLKTGQAKSWSRL